MKISILLASLFLSYSAFAGETVLVPDNPGGVDVCREFVAYHLGLDPLDITLLGETTAHMELVYKETVIGLVTSNADGSETATCSVQD